MSEASVFIDEIDVTNEALEGSVSRQLNGIATASVTLPMDVLTGDVGSLLKVYFDGVLHFHGRCLLVETDASEDFGRTVFNASDPLELWNHRPVRDPDGDFSNPDIIKDNITGPQIVEAMFDASENVPGVGIDDAEGPLRLAKGGFAVGGVDLTGTPTDWPMTMAELATLLVSTGEVDIIVTPIEQADSGYTCDVGSSTDIVYNIGQLDVYNGDYGNDLTTSVAFQYGMGLHNIRNFRWNKNMTNMCNKLWYYLGPRKDQQHWWANIVGTASSIFSACSSNQHAVYEAATDSRCLYDTRMDIRVFDDRDDEATLGMCLFARLWLIEQWLRAQPQEMIHITPTRDSDIGSFDIGDLVLVEATTRARGGFSGAQRVYRYTVSWDVDSVLALDELQVSADSEGFSA